MHCASLKYQKTSDIFSPQMMMQEVAVAWARRRGLRVARAGHVVICKRTGGIMFVDFVLEHRGRCGCIMGGKKRACYLASVYYSRSRGGAQLAYAKEYMRKVQRVCNQDMGFYPGVLAMCVYNGRVRESAEAMRVYAADVGVVYSQFNTI